MVKGKPWSVEDEKKLKEWVESGITDLAVLSFSFDGKYSRNAVYQKMLDLGIASKEEEASKHNSSSSTTLTLPDELPSVEEALKTLAAAMKALEQPGLDRIEVLRLRSLIQAASAYQIKLAEFVDYRGLEAEILELKRKYAELVKKTKSA
jgi:hypothetical protein